MQTPSSYRKAITYSYDPSTREWNVIGPGPAGVDALVTTRHGVMGVNVNWPRRENDAGYQFPRDPAQPSDNAIFLLRGARWERLSKGQPSPQNLFEMTSMAYDSKRDQVVLHGGGKRRDEPWVFDTKTLAWRNMQAKVASPAGTNPPGCTRESVYIRGEDVVLIIGDGGRTWEYSPAENAWRQEFLHPEHLILIQTTLITQKPRLRDDSGLYSEFEAVRSDLMLVETFR
ncbi:MAG TPA: hypothetical protein VFO27_15760 [Bryobacteraceae bacterium]|nr:hypothetical protein [Bryobacteraceae bacterium]